MNSGMYSALSGEVNMLEKLNVVSNNLANINTVGFKKDRFIFEKVLEAISNPNQYIGEVTDAPIISEVRSYTDFEAGAIRQTGNVFHMALDGEGFFAVNTPDGTAYTRQGNFQRDKNGRLITADGYEVLGRGGGAITLPGGKVDINADGTITVDGTNVGALEIVDFPQPYQLRKIGSALFLSDVPQSVPQPAPGTRIMQGYLEESNVNAIAEMTQMIECNRSFESCARVIRSYDEMAAKAIELGRPA